MVEVQDTFDAWIAGMDNLLDVEDQNGMMNDGGQHVAAEMEAIEEVAAEMEEVDDVDAVMEVVEDLAAETGVEDVGAETKGVEDFAMNEQEVNRSYVLTAG
jgi:hypothetical protein